MINKYIMTEDIKFDSLDLSIPNIISIYSKDNQQEIYEYLKSLNEMQRKAYLIAINHLGTSFNILKSNGFKEWKTKTD
jgi:hypothetical protein